MTKPRYLIAYLALHTMFSHAFSAPEKPIASIPSPTSTNTLSSCPPINDNDPLLPLPSSIILDVDGTLYDETVHKIEAQIIRNTHEFCEKHPDIGLTPRQSDELYKLHGSTVEGLRRTHPHLVSEFYDRVYRRVDVSSLRTYTGSGSSDSSSGYHHGSSSNDKIKSCLSALSRYVPIYVASNSPRYHVLRVLNSMGLSGVPFKGIITPCSTPDFWSKNNPERYYESILSVADGENALLLEDSEFNIIKAEELGIRGRRIGNGNLEEVLTDILTGARPSGEGGDLDPYQFSEVKYLRDKNKVDSESIHPEPWACLHSRLRELQTDSTTGTLEIVDLGAGILNMLRMMMEGTENKPSLLRGWARVRFVAYETNHNLVSECVSFLEGLGFVRLEEDDKDTEKEAFHFRRIQDDQTIDLSLLMEDFRKSQPLTTTPHLVVGCCFADLFPNPDHLISDISSLIGLHRSCDGFSDAGNVLMYFPITFTGITTLNPPQASEPNTIPSDTVALRCYSDRLSQDMGHNLDPNTLIDSVRERGGTVLGSGDASSPWNIDFQTHPYLYRTMMHFIQSSGTVGKLTEDGYDGRGWLRRFWKNRPNIMAWNLDLLFSLPLGAEEGRDVHKKEAADVDEIQFYEERKVRKVTRSAGDEAFTLGPNDLQVDTICSLISSGTELKIFTGSFSSTSPLDTTISSMSSQTMSYPLTYGYSLVGRVTKIGTDVPKHYLNKSVFSFSPHASRIISDVKDVHIIPEGISPEDAMFFPAVETALSIVQDAHPRLGETVGVFGQGLIGLLVTSLLAGHTGTDVTAFDTLPDRLAISASLGSAQALSPPSEPHNPHRSSFDKTIEVSGNPRALQSAIDTVRDGGTVVIASWYGNADVKLKLGIDFHRSKKTLITSQVSDIPAGLTGTWDKARRFDATWDLVKKLRPGRKLRRKVYTLEDCQRAYEDLEGGKEVAISFSYGAGL